MGAPMDYSNVQYLDMGKDKDGNERKIAYIKHEGTRKPGIIKVPGYCSEMVTEKAKALEDFCINNGYPYVKYEAEGTHMSPGVHRNITYQTWVEDAMAVLDRLTSGPQILVGSSLGGWTSTIMALRKPERIHSILMLAPGTMDYVKDEESMQKMAEWIKSMPPEEMKKFEAGDAAEILSPWGTIMKIWKSFYDDVPDVVEAGADIPIKCPVRFIHAIPDTSISYDKSVAFAQRLASDDVDVIVRKIGDHRLQSPSDCILIVEVVEALLKKYPTEK